MVPISSYDCIVRRQFSGLFQKQLRNPPCFAASPAPPTVSWSGKNINSNVYNPAGASPTTPVKALSETSSWTGVLTPNQSIVIAVAQ